MPPDESNEEYDTPFSPADNHSDDTYPSLDAEQDQTELYQGGVILEEPNAGNTVEGYDPSKDQRLK